MSEENYIPSPSAEAFKEPLTKYQALQLAAKILPDLDRIMEKSAELSLSPEQCERYLRQNYSVYDNDSEKVYLNMLFDLAETILEKDIEFSNEVTAPPPAE